MTRLRRNQSGTTLMELIVYLAISTVVIMSMTTFVSAMTASRVATANQQSAQAEARSAMERMTYSIRNSKDVAVSANRIDLTDESGIVASYCACDGALRTLTRPGIPAPVDELQPMTPPDISATADFTRISSAVRIHLELEKHGQRTVLDSTVSFRQR